MFRRMQDRWIARLIRYPFQNNNELYLFMISNISVAFCLAAHTGHVVLFLWGDMAPLALYNCFAVLLDLCLLPLMKRRKYAAVGLLIAAEVLLYGLLLAWIGGIGTYVLGYFLLIINMQLLFPYGTSRMRWSVAAVCLLATGASMGIHRAPSPPLCFSPAVEHILTDTNILLLILGCIIQNFLADLAGRTAARLHRLKMDDLASQVRTDPLTGLYNCRFAEGFFSVLASRQDNVPHCVVMIDIDDFKHINDAYGHECGDEVLQFLANFLLSRLRRTDVVIRWGGEEFLVILEGVTPDSAHGIVEKIRRELAQAVIPTRQGALSITFTAGLSPFIPQDPDRSVRQSDERMYYGKQNGKNRVVPAML